MKKIKMNIAKGFTLAEVLIVLGIIGVVAALTIPALISNYQKNQTVEKLKKSYTNLCQAIKLSEQDNGPNKDWDWGTDSITLKQSFDTYWAPYLKIMKYCNTFLDCGYKSGTWSTINVGGTGVIVDTASRTTVILADGVVFSVQALGWSGGVLVPGHAVKFDLNGSAPPNKVSIDVFYFVLDPIKGLMPIGYDSPQSTIKNDCSNSGTGSDCAAKIILFDNWQIASDYPWP